MQRLEIFFLTFGITKFNCNSLHFNSLSLLIKVHLKLVIAILHSNLAIVCFNTSILGIFTFNLRHNGFKNSDKSFEVAEGVGRILMEET